MKKVFLSLAMIATLTVVSCKETKTETNEETVAPTEEAAPVEAAPAEAAPAADTTATAAPAEAAPAEAAPAEKK